MPPKTESEPARAAHAVTHAITHAITDWVIDADTHITEPADVWTDRLEAKHQARAPRMIRNDDGVDLWSFGDTQRVIPVGHTAVAGWPEPLPAAPRNMDEVPPAAYDPKARLEYMDSIGVWAAALYPNVGGFGNESFLGLGDPALMLACVRAYNDWLIDWCSADPRRFIPVMATPFWDIDATANEVRRCAELGHKAILFTGAPHEFGFPYIGDPHWNPLWEAAQETKLPISLHIGSGNIQDEFPMEKIQAHGMGPVIASQTVSLLLKTGVHLVDLITSGVLPRHPDLKVAVVESGIGWIPFVLESLDYTFQYAKVRTHHPEFELSPTEYFRRQVYGCTFFEEMAPNRLLDTIGMGNVMFETDYPHPVCLYGNVREKIDAALKGQPREVQKRVLWRNAAQLYKVEEPDGAWGGD